MKDLDEILGERIAEELSKLPETSQNTLKKLLSIYIIDCLEGTKDNKVSQRKRLDNYIDTICDKYHVSSSAMVRTVNHVESYYTQHKIRDEYNASHE